MIKIKFMFLYFRCYNDAFPVKHFPHTVPGIVKKYIHVVSPSQCVKKIHMSYTLTCNQAI